MISNYDWEENVRTWLATLKNLKLDDEDGIILFFDRAFTNAQCTERAWFGVHTSIASLVVGGIFLAAVLRSGDNKGIWLLVDQGSPEIDGVQYHPAKSTQGSHSPLMWAHSERIEGAALLAENDDVWEWYQRATIKIFDSRRVAADRDSIQIKRGKRRLSDFWDPAVARGTRGIYPDEVDSTKIYKDGAVKKVTVNAYERNSRARRDCIKKYGSRCYICGFDFEQKYGSQAKGIIHVHHERPLSEIGGEYNLSAVDDLKPVCPNCHAVIHSKTRAYSIAEVKGMIRDDKTSA